MAVDQTIHQSSSEAYTFAAEQCGEATVLAMNPNPQRSKGVFANRSENS